MNDRSWGMTLGSLGVRRYSGQLTLRAEGKRYCIVFDHGAVVGATSPLASDSAARVALTHHLIAPASVAEITRRVAAAPGRDEVEVLAEAARLTLDQTLRLRRKVIEQRAARTFSIEDGQLTIDANVDIPFLTALAIDVRSVIYLGARMNLSEQRLGDELRQLGTHFRLEPAAIGELALFGFTAAEQPILDALHAGTSLAELEARHRELDPRTARAVIYALASCAIVTGEGRPPPRRAPAAAPDEAGVPRSGAGSSRAPTAPALSRAKTPAPATGRAKTPSGLPRARSAGAQGARRRTSATMAAARAAADASADTAAQADVATVAKEAFKRGQSRLRVENLEDAIVELTRAVELAPGEVDYAATLAWARFCHVKDKQALAPATREALGKAIRRSAAPETARFYLGRVERMLGRDKEALRHFQQVLEAQPRHADAAAEIRAIERRMAQAAAKESGVFGRKR